MSHPVRVRGLKHVCRKRNRFQLASHPVRVRGLKLKLASVLGKTIDVAPREGAWIETDTADTGQLDSESHPVRVRGLKRGSLDAAEKDTVSHPVRVRGLKRNSFRESVPVMRRTP